MLYWICFVLMMSIISGCNNSENTIKSEHLSLNGESENWIVNSYEITITKDSLKAGEGTLMMKSKIKSDYLHIKVHAVINDEDQVIQEKALTVTGGNQDIAKIQTGSIEGSYFNKEGEAINLDDIKNIYMVVEWRDPGSGDIVEEKIELHESA